MAAVETRQIQDNERSFAVGRTLGTARLHSGTRRGVWLRPLGNVIVIMPPLSISEHELPMLVEAIQYGYQQTF